MSTRFSNPDFTPVNLLGLRTVLRVLSRYKLLRPLVVLVETLFFMILDGLAHAMKHFASKMTLSPMFIKRQQKELEYLVRCLQSVEEAFAAEDTWNEYLAAWEGLFALRRLMKSEKGQQILQCVAMDASVARGLGVASALRHFHGTEPPEGVLKHVKDGPCKHISTHSFQYFTTIQDELVRIERVKLFQNQVFTLICSVLLALQIAGFNMLAQYYLVDWLGAADDTTDADLLALDAMNLNATG